MLRFCTTARLPLLHTFPSMPTADLRMPLSQLPHSKSHHHTPAHRKKLLPASSPDTFLKPKCFCSHFTTVYTPARAIREHKLQRVAHGWVSGCTSVVLYETILPETIEELADGINGSQGVSQRSARQPGNCSAAGDSWKQLRVKTDSWGVQLSGAD